MDGRFRRWWALVFVLGVALRLALWSGFGLGDDINYFTAYHGIYLSGVVGPQLAGRSGALVAEYDFRFAFWIPVVLSMKLLGPTEVGFTAFVTLCSLANLVLVYLLARQECERPHALLAMALLAVLPLEVLCSTLFVVDIPLATYVFAAFWLYRRALEDGRSRRARLACAAASALFLFLGYSAKQWAVLIAPLFVLEALRDLRRAWLPAFVTGGGFLALVGAYFAWQWKRFGDPIYDIHVVRSISIFLPHSRAILLDYPRMLFLPNQHGSWFAGWYPHALVLLAIACVARSWRAGRWLLYFVVLLAGLAAAPGYREHGQWLVPVPHIFRYLSFLSIPLCLALAAYLREVVAWRRAAGTACAAALLVLGVVQSVAVTRPTRDAFGDQRRAIAVLRDFPGEPVWCDGDFGVRFTSFAPNPQDAGRVRWLRSEDPVHRQAEFAAIKHGIVVTGGSRLPWYGCPRCTANLGDFHVPATWALIREFDGSLTGYRDEPRRLWRVSAAAAEAQALLAERATREAKRELLHELLERHDDAVAAEVGEALLRDAPAAERGDLLRWTGLALVRSGRWPRWERLLEEGLAAATDPAEVRDDLVQLALAAAARADFAKAGAWAAGLRERFPGSPPDPRLADIESGLAEGITMYHTGRLADARRRFAALSAHEDPSIRQRARYFLALTLFAMDRVAEALEQSDAYRADYGEDANWVELHYRHAEDLIVRDPAAAREILGDLVARFPASVWAGEARRRLDALPGAGSDSASGSS